MTTVRAQASLANSELTKARDFLSEADALVTNVRLLFLNNDFATAGRQARSSPLSAG